VTIKNEHRHECYRKCFLLTSAGHREQGAPQGKGTKEAQQQVDIGAQCTSEEGREAPRQEKTTHMHISALLLESGRQKLHKFSRFQRIDARKVLLKRGREVNWLWQDWMENHATSSNSI
jgi:hypothetical protein